MSTSTMDTHDCRSSSALDHVVTTLQHRFSKVPNLLVLAVISRVMIEARKVSSFEFPIY
jgi:hypothetical protein